MEARSNSLPPKSPSRPRSYSSSQPTLRSGASRRSGSTSSSSSSKRTPPQSVDGDSTISKSELSDLTGSYMNGDRSQYPRCRPEVPSHVYPADVSISSVQRSWRQAYVLATRACEADQCLLSNHCNDDRLSIVEQITHVDIARQVKKCPRIPLVILCMDPYRKLYEMIQMWIDPDYDSVRDVLGSVKCKLSAENKWRQDYDGLFHLKGTKVFQLIHCLGVRNYEVQPFEVWIAKPWSMATTATANYGLSLLEHLREIGVVTLTGTTCRLTMMAQARIYAPNGTMKHHHAQQYLSFSPPFEQEESSQESVAGSVDDNSSLQSGGASAMVLSQSEDASTSMLYTRTGSSSVVTACTSPTYSTSTSKHDACIPSDASETCVVQHATNEELQFFATSGKGRMETQPDYYFAETTRFEEDQTRKSSRIGCMSKLLCKGRSTRQLHYSKFESRTYPSEMTSSSSCNFSSTSSGKPSMDFGSINSEVETPTTSQDFAYSNQCDVPLLLPRGFVVDKTFSSRKNKVAHSDTSSFKPSTRGHYKDLR